MLIALGAGSWIVREWRLLFRLEVSGSSMQPLLRPGDFLVARQLGSARPAAGDVVALRAGDRTYVKRIVGLPGETVRLGSGVEIDSLPIHEPYLFAYLDGSRQSDQTQPDDASAGPMHTVNVEGVTLAEGEYFVLGDRRDASTDSRNFGPVPLEALRGRVFFRYWPPARVGRVPRGRREAGSRNVLAHPTGSEQTLIEAPHARP